VNPVGGGVVPAALNSEVKGLFRTGKEKGEAVSPSLLGILDLLTERKSKRERAGVFDKGGVFFLLLAS